MIYYNWYDNKRKIIARCQTIKNIDVLKKMGRQIAGIREMKESVVCSLTGSPSDYNMDY